MSIPKQITFISEQPDIINDTIREFCGPIISTLGPGGQTVIIADEESVVPHVTKDGVTVSESIHFSDPRKQAIASLIKEAARKTAGSVGDGTTTSVVLAGALITKGLDSIRSVKSKKEFFDGFDLAFEKVIDLLSESNIPISKDSELLGSVVQISTNGDEKVCKHIMSAIKAAGPDGLVNVEVHDELYTTVDIKGGSSIESNAHILGKRWEVSGDIQLILISGPLKDVYEIKPILTSTAGTDVPVVIIAKEFSEAIISTVMTNNQRKKINIALIESEGFARGPRMDILEDLSLIFEVPIYSTDGSTTLPLSSYDSLHCQSEALTKAIVTANETVLFRDNEVLSVLAAERYAGLKKEYDEAKTSKDESSITDSGNMRFLQKRMAKYNTVATIKVGAATKAEAVEIRDRIEDALHSISSAVNGGITQGGGMALLKAAFVLRDLLPSLGLSDSAQAGYTLISKACCSPFYTLAVNSGVMFPGGQVPEELTSGDKVYDFRD